MALQKSYTDDSGATHSSAYFKISKIDLLNPAGSNSVANVFLQVYHDSAARSATPPKNPMKSWSYFVTGSDYDTFFATSVLDAANSNPIKKGYDYLKVHTPATGPGPIFNSGEVDLTTGTTDV